ncbi:succinate CoA transferase [Gluconacetobacter tumulicola]|uniref:Succinate CoA transferase n=1 Tax=Gluconacetobacter tumulicola TaxID=1017177 RepID=A0A7W4P9Y6_9PROT|nr:succinate CoA transferase [Gluconacetobacter tumulicola]MBB2180988.1 succinate CoA transferase [Gluconacetobacter tumulicola]
MAEERVHNAAFRHRIMDADEAACLIAHGDVVGMGGFGPGGTPKALPRALARRAIARHERGEPFAISLLTGASTTPDVDGVLARAEAISFRMPYMGDADLRAQANEGKVAYVDTHLSRVAPWARAGFLGKVDVAVIEAALIREDGGIVPTLAIGNAKTWLEMADRVIIEVNGWHTTELEGIHDIWAGDREAGARLPVVSWAGERIGGTVLRVPPDKIAAVVRTDEGDLGQSFRAVPDATRIAGHIIEFLKHEVARGRLPEALPPLQSGVGNIANAVMTALADAPFENLTAYTEVIQDGMLDMVRSGKMRVVSGASLYLSREQAAAAKADMAVLRDRLVLRQQEVSNNPAVARGLNCIAMNAGIEADIYGNVNSTRVMGSRVQNGIGGSGDFARSALLSIFMLPSVARNGTISSIVPMVSHVDHINQDVQVLVTEQGLADLRGLSARRRARVIIENCAHPDFRPQLRDYLARAERVDGGGGDTPHLLGEALSWHQRFIETGSMRI